MKTIDQEGESVTKEVQTAVRHGAVYGVGNMLIKVLGFVMLPFYTHYLNPRDYGVLEILDLSMSMLGMFLNMGMTAALLRCYTAASGAEEKRKAVSTAFLFVAATGLFTFIAGFKLIAPASAMLVGPEV